MVAVWGPVLLGVMTAAPPGKTGSAKGGEFMGVAGAYSAAVRRAPN